MKRNSIRIFSICIAMMVLLASFAGCGGAKDKEAAASTVAATEATKTAVAGADYTQLLGSVQDTSDLPTWAGNQLKLKEWYAHGSGDADHTMADKDVVGPEAKRVTGVELDRDASFDNGGNTVDVKMAMLSAADDWPDVVQTSGPEQLKQMIMAGKLYDLTDVMSKYCPDITKKFDVQKYPKILQKMTGDDSGISKRAFFLPTLAGIRFSRKLEVEKTDFDPLKWANMDLPRPKTDWPRIWVRDDILKKMYPNAMTQDEIEDTYVKNGTFTREQIFDVPLKTAADFYKFLADMKKLIDTEKIKVANKPAEVTYAAFGGDNWQMFACLVPEINGMPTGNYFSFYDKTTNKLAWSFKSDFFKSWAAEFQKLVTSGIASKESLLDNGATFQEKLNAGRYAVTYAWSKPDEKALKAAGLNFRYRQLFVDTTNNYDRFVSIDGAPAPDMYWGIFKDSVSEKDLPQVLGYMNYMVSDIGEKLVSWGPKSAGLFTEADGVRTYVDKELESNMAFGKDTKVNLSYGLYNAFLNSQPTRMAWPYYPTGSEGNVYHPRYTYTGAPRDKGQADARFQPGMLPGESLVDYQVVAFKSDFLPDYSTQWETITKGRDAFERALTATLAAKDSAQFDKLWQTMIDTGTSVGMDDKTLEEMNKIFAKNNPTFAEDAAKVHN